MLYVKRYPKGVKLSAEHRAKRPHSTEVHKFINKDGRTFEGTMVEFKDLLVASGEWHKDHLYSVARGTKLSYKGWKLPHTTPKTRDWSKVVWGNASLGTDDDYMDLDEEEDVPEEEPIANFPVDKSAEDKALKRMMGLS